MCYPDGHPDGQVARKPTGNDRLFPLPVDVALYILDYLESPGSLFAAVLTSRVFWYAFESRRQHVLRSVLGRYIGPRLMPLAVAVYEAGPLGQARDWESLEPILQRSLGEEPAANAPSPAAQDDSPPPTPTPPPPRHDPLERISPLTCEAAAALTEVHRAVARFSLDLARPALALVGSIYTEGDDAGAWRERRGEAAEEPTERELQRIQRAFYRYQLYCSTAGRASMDDARVAPVRGALKTKEERQRAQALLIGRWPTVVNEQLACACSFLEKKMEYHFDILAEHDVEWGTRKVDWVSPHVAVPHRRFLLNGGLLPLYRMSRTSDEDEWKRIIEGIDVPFHYDQTRFRYLETLEGRLAVFRQSYLSTCLMMSLHGPPGMLAPPSGPPSPHGWEDVDKSVAEDDGGSRSQQQAEAEDDNAEQQERRQQRQRQPRYMSETCHVDDMLGQRGAHLRDAGFVFWDGAERGGVAPDAKLRVSAEHGWRYARPAGAAASARLLCRMRRSWERRAQIWAQGGSGHWDEADDSLVVWAKVRA